MVNFFGGPPQAGLQLGKRRRKGKQGRPPRHPHHNHNHNHTPTASPPTTPDASMLLLPALSPSSLLKALGFTRANPAEEATRKATAKLVPGHGKPPISPIKPAKPSPGHNNTPLQEASAGRSGGAVKGRWRDEQPRALEAPREADSDGTALLKGCIGLVQPPSPPPAGENAREGSHGAVANEGASPGADKKSKKKSRNKGGSGGASQPQSPARLSPGARVEGRSELDSTAGCESPASVTGGVDSDADFPPPSPTTPPDTPPLVVDLPPSVHVASLEHATPPTPQYDDLISQDYACPGIVGKSADTVRNAGVDAEFPSSSAAVGDDVIRDAALESRTIPITREANDDVADETRPDWGTCPRLKRKKLKKTREDPVMACGAEEAQPRLQAGSTSPSLHAVPASQVHASAKRSPPRSAQRALWSQEARRETVDQGTPEMEPRMLTQHDSPPRRGKEALPPPMEETLSRFALGPGETAPPPDGTHMDNSAGAGSERACSNTVSLAAPIPTPSLRCQAGIAAENGSASPSESSALSSRSGIWANYEAAAGLGTDTVTTSGGWRPMGAGGESLWAPLQGSHWRSGGGLWGSDIWQHPSDSTSPSLFTSGLRSLPTSTSSVGPGNMGVGGAERAAGWMQQQAGASRRVDLGAGANEPGVSGACASSRGLPNTVSTSVLSTDWMLSGNPSWQQSWGSRSPSMWRGNPSADGSIVTGAFPSSQSRDASDGEFLELPENVSLLRAMSEATDAAYQPMAAAGGNILPGGGFWDEKCCCVCMDAPRDYAFTPCGHRCVCRGCAETTLHAGHAALCPVCRRKVLGTLRIYD